MKTQDGLKLSSLREKTSLAAMEQELRLLLVANKGQLIEKIKLLEKAVAEQIELLESCSTNNLLRDHILKICKEARRAKSAKWVVLTSDKTNVDDDALLPVRSYQDHYNNLAELCVLLVGVERLLDNTMSTNPMSTFEIKEFHTRIEKLKNSESPETKILGEAMGALAVALLVAAIILLSISSYGSFALLVAGAVCLIPTPIFGLMGKGVSANTRLIGHAMSGFFKNPEEGKPQAAHEHRKEQLNSASAHGAGAS